MLRKSPKSARKRTNVVEVEEEEDETGIEEISDIQQIVPKCRNIKINKFMEEINRNANQKDIVLLLIDIADRPEISIDYNISIPHYLALYLRCPEEPILSEAGCLIINAAKIYARRVDNIREDVERTLVGFEEVLNGKRPAIENEPPPEAPKKKASKRSLPNKDYLYEADMIIPEIKYGTEEKIFERDSQLNSFDPPKRYIDDIKKYKEWRSSKRQKTKPTRNFDENFIDPVLWKHSRIEDFDYDDDVDTKRNYRVYTSILDNRYSCPERDVDFAMHFMMKDFIEAEEEEIEEQIALGLPARSKRQWPPLCSADTTPENDYFHTYIDLENTILQNGPINHMFEDLGGFSFLEKRRKRDNEVTGTVLPSTVELENIAGSSSTVELENIAGSSSTVELEKSSELPSTVELENIAGSSSTVELEKSAELPSTVELENSAGQSSTVELEKSTELPSTVELENSAGQSSTVELEKSVEDTVTPTDTTPAVMPENSNDEQNLNIIPPTTEELLEPSPADTQPEIFDPQKIIVRLSTDDEGVFFGDLDEIDRAMLNPRVIATNITQSMEKDIQNVSNLVIKVDANLERFFGIDESYIKFREELNGTLDCRNNLPINLNILRLPERKLRKRKTFRLPKEFDLFKKDRLKKPRSRPTELRVSLNLFKLNDTNANIEGNRSSSPAYESDFLGFEDDEIRLPRMEILKYINDIVNLENGIGKVRSASLDSGIEFPDLTTNRNLLNAPTDEEVLVNSTANDNPDLSGAILHSTAIDDVDKDKQSATPTNNIESDVNNVTEQTLPHIVINEKPNESDTSEQPNITDSGINCTDISGQPNISDSGINCTDTSEQPNITDSGIICSDSLPTTQPNESPATTNNENKSSAQQIQNHFQMNEMILKIQSWHRYLRPILAKSKDRNHFDVFEMGTEIMDHFPADNQPSTSPNVTFKDVMKDKDPIDTSRYFLSMLLLANSNNITINVENNDNDNDNDNDNKPAKSEDIHLSLLHRKRHTISVEDNIGQANTKRVCSESNSVVFSKPSKFCTGPTKKKSVRSDDNDSGFHSNGSSNSLTLS